VLEPLGDRCLVRDLAGDLEKAGDLDALVNGTRLDASLELPAEVVGS